MIIKRLLCLKPSLRSAWLNLPSSCLHSTTIRLGKVAFIDDDDKLKRGSEDTDEETCLFPMIKNLDVSSSNGMHAARASCTSIYKIIKMGGINKVLSAQYSHYLNYLCRNSDENTDIYANISRDLVLYMTQPDNDISILQKCLLISDCSTSSKENCIKMCDLVRQRPELIQSMNGSNFIKILFSCHKFGLWQKAYDIFDSRKGNFGDMLTLSILDSFTEHASIAAKIYKDSQLNGNPKVELRNDILRHHHQIMVDCSERYQLFSTRHSRKYLQTLTDLDINVHEGAIIKMSGRCTKCKDKLPLFDNSALKEINSSIRNLLNRKLDAKSNEYASATEIMKFESYLRNLYEHDDRPIDCVIDALNISNVHSARSEYREFVKAGIVTTQRVVSSESKARLLMNTIIRNDMIKKFRKILVVGRRHQEEWTGLLDFTHKNGIHFYGAKNDTADDLFQLYAATLSPHTVLISNDAFRDFTKLLDYPSRTKLISWFNTHQAPINRKTLMATWPSPFEKVPSIDRESERFHIPLIDYNQYQRYMVNDPNQPSMNHIQFIKWLCCDSKMQTNVSISDNKES